MGTFEISWTEETWMRMRVQAESVDHARELFWSGGLNFDEAWDFGSEIQDSVDVREVV